MKIMDNLWQVGGAEFTTVEDAAVYLVRFGEKAALFDSGCGSDHDTLVMNISEVLPSDVEIEYLFLTHCHYDHTGGAERTRSRYGCKIVAHELDAEHLEIGDSRVTALNSGKGCTELDASAWGPPVSRLRFDNGLRRHFARIHARVTQ